MAVTGTECKTTVSADGMTWPLLWWSKSVVVMPRSGPGIAVRIALVFLEPQQAVAFCCSAHDITLDNDGVLIKIAVDEIERRAGSDQVDLIGRIYQIEHPKAAQPATPAAP